MAGDVEARRDGTEGGRRVAGDVQASRDGIEGGRHYTAISIQSYLCPFGDCVKKF